MLLSFLLIIGVSFFGTVGIGAVASAIRSIRANSRYTADFDVHATGDEKEKN